MPSTPSLAALDTLFNHSSALLDAIDIRHPLAPTVQGQAQKAFSALRALETMMADTPPMPKGALEAHLHDASLSLLCGLLLLEDGLPDP